MAWTETIETHAPALDPRLAIAAGFAIVAVAPAVFWVVVVQLVALSVGAPFSIATLAMIGAAIVLVLGLFWSMLRLGPRA